VRAFFNEALGCGQANPAASACDYRNFSRQFLSIVITHMFLLCFCSSQFQTGHTPAHLHSASDLYHFTCCVQVSTLTPMKRTAKKPKADYRSHCPVNFAVESLGDRWALLIVRDMVFHGKKTYGEFLKAEEGIATNILASRLDFLERIEVIKKSPHGEDQRKDIYTLTEKGLDLIPVLFEFIKWSAKHDPLSSSLQYPQFLKQLKANRGKFNKKVRDLVRSGSCLFTKVIHP
jgi:DNA-binding HxlR family transcriptional regulator